MDPLDQHKDSGVLEIETKSRVFSADLQKWICVFYDATNNERTNYDFVTLRDH